MFIEKMLPLLLALSVSLQGPLAAEDAAESRGDGIAGAVQAALPRLDSYIREAMERTGVPGAAVAVVFQDEAVLLEGYGLRRADGDLPVDADTVFQMASLSKPMSSTVVAAAVDRGWLEWTDPVASWQVGLALSDSWLTAHVSVADLLSHRSGLPDHAGDFLEDLGFDRPAILERIGMLEPDYPFRAGYAYTNAGFTAGALAAARAAGIPWPDLARELVFDPLGMASTSFRFADYRAAANRADIHVRRADRSWAALYERDADPQAPAGGLSTTARDYVRWMRMQLNEGVLGSERVVSEEQLSQTWRPHSQKGYDPSTHRASYYGLGWGVAVKDEEGLLLSHSGAFDLGARTCVHLYPERGLGIAILVNGGSNGVPEAVAFAFEDMVFRGALRRDWIAFADEQFLRMGEEMHAYQVDPADRPPDPRPPAELSSYAGLYGNPYYGPLAVEETAEGLAFRLGPEGMRFALEPWDGDTFLFQPRGENAGGPGTVEFARGPEGTAEAVTIPYWNGEGMGTFARSGG